MTDVAIQVQGLGKRYRLGEARPSFPTMRDAIVASARRTGRLLSSPLRSLRSRPPPETFWALRDVSFEVERGEVVGIIGGNGAGKSTLLKILSRITEPTEGRVEVHGRVGSLLEVGTGFHPELTGRENTFLNGAILGMTREEIEGKFDEIVGFAEVERFIDTPVKHYSSGMYLRLAFAVAAHLEPEILLVDEVLAVGDAAFQRKCLGKMSDIAREGRTVLFVSHNMDPIQRLCSRCIMLEEGRIAAEGRTGEVVPRYLSRARGTSGPRTWIDLSAASREGNGRLRFAAAWYSGTDPSVGFRPRSGEGIEIRLDIQARDAFSVTSLGIAIQTLTGTLLVNADTTILGEPVVLVEGANAVVFTLEKLHLNPGRYLVDVWATDAFETIYDSVESAFELEVVDLREATLGVTPEIHGAVACDFTVHTTSGGGMATPSFPPPRPVS